MRNMILVFSILLNLGIVYGQTLENSIQVGTNFTIGKPTKGLDYNHIQFPKRNIIIKRGVIVNFNTLRGRKVEVVEFIPNKNGNTTIVLRRKDGEKFFRFYPTITANLDQALKSGELKVIDPTYL